MICTPSLYTFPPTPSPALPVQALFSITTLRPLLPRSPWPRQCRVDSLPSEWSPSLSVLTSPALSRLSSCFLVAPLPVSSCPPDLKMLDGSRPQSAGLRHWTSSLNATSTRNRMAFNTLHALSPQFISPSPSLRELHHPLSSQRLHLEVWKSFQKTPKIFIYL